MKNPRTPLRVRVVGPLTTVPLTDAALRATPVPVSGSVSTTGLTDAQLRAADVKITLDGESVPVTAAALPLPSGAATEAGNLATIAAKDFATQTTLALIRTAVEVIDNFISGARGLVTEDNSGAIKTAVETIDNFISGARGLVTEDNSAAIKTAVETLDNCISGSRALVTEDNSASILSALGTVISGLAAVITELQFKADLAETQPVSLATAPDTPVTGLVSAERESYAADEQQPLSLTTDGRLRVATSESATHLEMFREPDSLFFDVPALTQDAHRVEVANNPWGF